MSAERITEGVSAEEEERRRRRRKQEKKEVEEKRRREEQRDKGKNSVKVNHKTTHRDSCKITFWED